MTTGFAIGSEGAVSRCAIPTLNEDGPWVESRHPHRGVYSAGTMPIRSTLILALSLTLILAGCGTTRFMAKAHDGAMSAPPVGQVLVNIIRPSGFAGGQDMPVFDGTAGTLIGNLRGKERVQYVCPPGERMFIGWGESKSGVAATLAAGKVYDLICDSGIGFWRASVSLRPIPKIDERRAKLPGWESSTTLLRFAGGADATAWTSGKIDDVKKIADEFRVAPTDRVMTLKADDCR